MRLFGYARHALADFVLISGVNEGTLYVPSYICAEAVETLEELGQEICYYPVNEGLEPEWTWLAGSCGPRSKAVLLVHYFGFPNAVDNALAFCRERQLLMIEDCAHSFLTTLHGRTIGAFGDAGFYSLRKTLPLPDGAGLVVNADDSPSFPGGSQDNMAGTPYRPLLARLIKFGASKTGVPSPLWRRWQSRSIVSPSNNATLGHTAARPGSMTRVSHRIMRVLEPAFGEIMLRRRHNYQRLAAAFASYHEVRLLYPQMDPGVCPYLFPVLVRDRDEVVRRLRSRGIPAQGWPALPRAVLESPAFQVAIRYARDLLTLPVHQDLDDHDIDYIIETYETPQTTNSPSSPEDSNRSVV